MKRRLHVSGLAAIVLGFSLVPFATSQVVAQSIAGPERPMEGALPGVVRDSSGAVIPRPTIVLRQDPSGLERVINGAANGTFSVPRVAPGRYLVTASVPGFATTSDATEVPTVTPLNLTLSPAAIIEQVTVVSASRQEELRDTSFADPGILLLAHGGNAEWNARVTELAAKIDNTRPTEVAFGMATRANIQAAVDRLVARRVTEIVAVPLFVSSWSSIITSTEYLLGLRAEAPAALAAYAKMNHAPAAAATSGTASAGHDGHTTAADGTTPVTSPVSIRMTPALNDHPIVADILATRARSISQNPTNDALIIVAHGPNEEEDNRRWLVDMSSVANRIRVSDRFASIDVLTLRDDARKPVRDRATGELRELIMKRSQEGRRVLIVPLLISFGGIDRGLRERLEGLPYAMPNAGLVPDDRLATWVLAMVDGR